MMTRRALDLLLVNMCSVREDDRLKLRVLPRLDDDILRRAHDGGVTQRGEEEQ
jgi:hypothetical protein